MKLKKSELILLGLIFLLALGLRLYQAINNPAWLDEITLYVISSTNSMKDLFLIQHWDTAHPPLLYLLTRLLLNLRNLEFISIKTLRIFFALTSALTVFPIYLVSKKIVNSKLALFIPVWYGINQFQILNGYQFRPYALLQPLLTCAYFSFFSENWNKKWKIIFFNFLFTILIWLDFASVWFFFPFFCHLFLFNKKNILLRIRQLFPFIVLSTYPLYKLITNLQYTTSSLLSNYGTPNIYALYNQFLGLGNKSTIFLGNYAYLILLILSSCLVLFGFILIFRDKNFKFLLLLVIAPLVVSYGYSFIKSPIVVDHNLISVSLSLLILFSVFLKDKRKGIFVGSLLSVLMIWHTIYSPSWFIGDEFKQDITISLKQNEQENIVFYIYYDYLEDPTYYFLLSKGFKFDKEQNIFFNATSSFSPNIQKLEMKDLTENNSFSQRFFITKAKFYNFDEIQRIIQFCPLKQEAFEQILTQGEGITLFKCE